MQVCSLPHTQLNLASGRAETWAQIPHLSREQPNEQGVQNLSHVKHKSPFVLEVTAASSRRNFPQDYLVLMHTLEYFEKK